MQSTGIDKFEELIEAGYFCQVRTNGPVCELHIGQFQLGIEHQGGTIQVRLQYVRADLV